MKAENRFMSQFQCYLYCMGILACSVMPFATSMDVDGDEIQSKTHSRLVKISVLRVMRELFSAL